MIKVRAPGKLNLGFDIVGKRPDGYHLVDTVYISVDLYDIIKLTVLPQKKIIVKCTHPEVPENRDNIVWKAAHKIQQHFGINQGILIEIDKHIPVGGGMAGGSTDAATILRYLPQLWNIKLTPKLVEEWAIELGADVLYCYLGGVMRGEGIGTLLTPINNTSSIQFAILPQPWVLSTAKVFSAWRDLRKSYKVNIDKVIMSLENNNLDLLCNNISNVLEDAIFKIVPDLKYTLDRLRDEKLNAFITGSGSTIYVVIKEKDDIIRLRQCYQGKILMCSLI